MGYPLTGMLASAFGFRSAFWFAVAFLITALAAVQLVVPDGPDERAPRGTFDTAGAVLLGLGLSAFLLAVSEGSNHGWLSVPTLGITVFSLVIFVAWVVTELKKNDSLVDLRVFRSSDVVVANGTAIGLGIALYIGLSVGGMTAQASPDTGYGIGLPLFWAGFVMLPLSVGSLGAGRMVRLLTRRGMSMTTMLPFGATVMSVAALLLWQVHDGLSWILLGTLLFGIGLGATYAAMPALIARHVIAVQLGSAVSFNQVLRTVGGAIGSAVSGAALASSLNAGGNPTETGICVAFGIGFLCSATVLAALCLNSARGRRRNAAEQPIPPSPPVANTGEPPQLLPRNDLDGSRLPVVVSPQIPCILSRFRPIGGPFMCTHIPPCSPADDPANCHRARVVADRAVQGWQLLCNGVIVFDDDYYLRPDGVSGHMTLV